MDLRNTIPMSSIIAVMKIALASSFFMPGCCDDLSLFPQSLDGLGRRGDLRDNSAEIFSQSFLQEVLCNHFWHGQRCPLFDAVHPAFPMPTAPLPTLQGAQKNSFGEVVASLGHLAGSVRKLILLCTQSLVVCSQ